MTDLGTGYPLAGSCSCQKVSFHLLREPMFVHCCHCTWCQRETGSAFAVNAMIESANVKLLKGEVAVTPMPTNSGIGQKIIRCNACKSALWSHYGAADDRVSFVRVGTLDTPKHCSPDIHIYTSSTQLWVNLQGKVPVVEEYYRRSLYWPEDSVLRYKQAVST